MSEEKIDFAGVDTSEEKKDDGLEELGLSDLQRSWLKNPKVGEELVLDIKKVFKDKNITAKNKEGEQFKTNFSGADYKCTFETKDGKFFSTNVWEIFGKIKKLMSEQKKIDIKVKIKHIVDGGLATERPERVAKLEDCSIDEAKEKIKKAQEAKKAKELYEVTLA